MIASLNGLLSAKSTDSVTVEVGGVGYKVFLSLQSFSRLPPVGEKVLLFIHTAVREDDIALFGFVLEEEKKIFQKLITVNGIGPRLALTILSGILPEDLIDALHREDLVRLTAISGIGKKTAERMILDLKDKLTEFLTEARSRGIGERGDYGKRRLFEDAVSALVNLGYTRGVAEKTLLQLPLKDSPRLDLVIRDALKIISEARQ